MSAECIILLCQLTGKVCKIKRLKHFIISATETAWTHVLQRILQRNCLTTKFLNPNGLVEYCFPKKNVKLN